VRDALAKLNFESLYGTIAFAEDGQIRLPQTVIQIQGDEVVPIYGKQGFITQPKYPMPAWNARQTTGTGR
jgi:branched-chain amino acid transport system substrate-binding protein